MIGADVRFAELNVKEDAVLYIHNGVAMVREIVSMPIEMYEAMKNAAERSEIMSRAKQMGTAIMIYAADYDDEMPTSFDPNAINPYIKNQEIMNGFVYTFGGGPLSKVENPSGTEMGYISGPGGRAVVYMDGHVKWISDPKPTLAKVLTTPIGQHVVESVWFL